MELEKEEYIHIDFFSKSKEKEEDQKDKKEFAINMVKILITTLIMVNAGNNIESLITTGKYIINYYDNIIMQSMVYGACCFYLGQKCLEASIKVVKKFKRMLDYTNKNS